ncbi:GDP-fucose transporter 1 [Agrilus planipennis]|uniref:GDP-fucose transporter 1 n=1 Tax=Agrilus planipennis TaxID=224129 RepID=A0A1W4XDX3_AGRPL|nr:GDP-fucose transporter 1 [Agrilus planipennis]
MPEKVSLLNKYITIFLVVSGYWIISILTVFVNKALLSSIELEAPMFIALFQTMMSVFVCYCMKLLSKVFPSYCNFPDSSPFKKETLKEVFPVSVLFTMMIAMNNLCLKYVSVTFYYIGRSLTTIFNVAFTYLILGEKTSGKCLFFCAVIILGFYLGVDQESLAGSLSISGTIYGVLASLSLSLYSIFTKRALPSLKQEVWLLSYYNNVYSSFLFVLLMLTNGELSNVLEYKRLYDYTFWFIMIMGGICGFSVGFFTSLQIKYTSALTHNISGTAKACAQTVLATYWYQESKSLLWWFSNSVVLLGSAGYARAKQVEMERKHKESLNYEKLGS